jgi:hypothetical protein
MLLACFGVDVLFKTARISFPPSVACLILLFLGLLLCEALLGSNKTRRIVAVIDVPVGYAPYIAPDLAVISLICCLGRMVIAVDKRLLHTDLRAPAVESKDRRRRGDEDHCRLQYVPSPQGSFTAHH